MVALVQCYSSSGQMPDLYLFVYPTLEARAGILQAPPDFVYAPHNPITQPSKAWSLMISVVIQFCLFRSSMMSNPLHIPGLPA